MKRFLLTLFFGLLLSFVLLAPVSAQADTPSWVDSGYPDSMSAAQGGDVNAAAHVSNVNTNNYSDFIRRTLGPVEGITVGVGQMDTPYAQQMLKQSALSGLTTYIIAMYSNPPASTYAFVEDLGQTLGFMPKQVHAQGIGFSGLVSLLPVWKQFRNISYAILALVMVIVGFMVMFRKKIDPKTVVTVQNALPKIVMTLILITFSYAIVGIMIDIMYIVLIFGVRLIVNSSPAGTFSADHIQLMTTSNFIGAMKGLFAGMVSTKDIVDFLNPLLTSWWAKLPAYIVEGTIIGVLLSLGLLFAVIRMFFMLLSSYIQIILALITGPVQILLDAVPGGTGFSAWLKNLISHLLVFPITAIMITIGWVLIKTSTITWTPPLLGTGGAGIGGIIGLGMLMTIPSVVKGMQESLKAKPMINVGAGAALSPLTGAFNTTTQSVSSFYYMNQIFEGIKNKGKHQA